VSEACADAGSDAGGKSANLLGAGVELIGRAPDCLRLQQLSFAFRSPAMQLDDMTISSLEIWRTAPVRAIKVHAQKFRRTLAQQP
jgi:hypothetical protein